MNSHIFNLRSLIKVSPLRCCQGNPFVTHSVNLIVYVYLQCPLNRSATVEEEDCDCVVGPPGPTVTHIKTYI